jgi:DnaJ-class molecular chaperone
MANAIADKEDTDQTRNSSTCKTCKGTGLVGNHLICNSCRGFGFASSQTVQCARCHGTGFIKSHVSCDRCGGFGSLPVK